MTETELEEILKVGEEALENDPYCMCHDHTVASVVDLVGRAVLHAAAEKQRAAIKDFDLDDHWAVYYRAEDVEKLPDLIDPDKQEQP